MSRRPEPPEVNDPLSEERWSLLRALGLLLFATGVLFAAAYLLLGAFVAAVPCVLAAGRCAWLLRRLNHRPAPSEEAAIGRNYTVTFFLSLLGVAVTTGGWDAPVNVWLVLVPMIGTVVGGLRRGAVWAVVTAGTVLALFGLRRWGVAFASPLTEEAHEALEVAGSVMLVLLVVAILGRYEHAHRRMVGRLARSREALKAARDHAEEACRAKSTFLANVSHEVRTPMNGVIGMAELLLASRQTAEQRERTETIRNSADALLSVLNDILDFSKIESGRLSVEHVPFCPAEVAGEVVDLLAPRAVEKKLELFLVAPDAGVLLGDPHRFRQIATNLVGNAVKFTERGEVEVGLRLSAPTEAGVRLVMTVRDTGPGIDPAWLGRLFLPFMQGDASTTRRYGGTGLGLAITRELVEIMDGQITVQSELGRGSEFRVDLCLPPAPPGAETAELPGRPTTGPLTDAGPADRLAAAAEAPPRLRVLCAEPHPGARAALGAALEAAGADGVFVDDPAAGAPPDGAGYDVVLWPLHWARPAGLGGPGAKVLLMGPGARPTLPPGVDGWLPKPVSLARLRRRLGEATRRPADGLGGIPCTPPSLEAPACRILVAEDNPINRRVMEAMLGSLGVHPVLVDDGAAALRAVQSGEFDLVLLDGQMPVMDGEAAARAIRALPPPKGRVPIVAVTAHALASDRERFLAVGMDDHLPKPVTLAALAGLLARFGFGAGGPGESLGGTVPPRELPAAEAAAPVDWDACRRALQDACGAAVADLDEDAIARAWRRLRSAALWAEWQELAALADRPAGEPADRTAQRLTEARALTGP